MYQQFSSFQIGKMLNVSRQAVNQWIDKGYIISYRTPGGHRRVRRDDLMHFLRTRNIPVPPMLQEDADTQPPTMLVVDDDRDYLALLKHSLQEQFANAEITTFSNGYDALVALGATPPDLLILDLMMPAIGGEEVVKRLRENPVTRNMQILIVTGKDLDTAREMLKPHGVTEVVSKDATLDEIAERINVLLKGAAVQGKK